MRNPLQLFKRKKNKADEAAPMFPLNVVALPRKAVEKGMLLYVDKDGARPVPDIGNTIEELNCKFEIGYDPSFRGSWSWFVKFGVSYTWRGCCYGAEAVELVRDFGLEFPDNSQYSINEDGSIMFFFQEWPDAEKIRDIVLKTQRQVERLLEMHTFNKASERARNPKKGSK